jgi:hypothetical protein
MTTFRPGYFNNAKDYELARFAIREDYVQARTRFAMLKHEAYNFGQTLAKVSDLLKTEPWNIDLEISDAEVEWASVVIDLKETK